MKCILCNEESEKPICNNCFHIEECPNCGTLPCSCNNIRKGRKTERFQMRRKNKEKTISRKQSRQNKEWTD